MMDQLIARFTDQLREALDIGEKARINAHKYPINKIFATGLGGSGIGGDFVNGFIQNQATVPFFVNKGYHIPNYIDNHTLALVSSYSGNTEETLAAFNQLLTTGAKIVTISSGGKLIEYSEQNNLDYICLPDDWPSPRACLGYSLVQQLAILYKLQITNDVFLKNIETSISLLDKEEENIKNQAKTVAEQLFKKIPVIYTTDRMEAVAVRFRQQINENAKSLCWHHVIPEMNHNELVGWRDKNDDLAVVYFRNDDDFKRNQIRMEINQKIILKYTPHIINLFSKGNNLIERTLYFVHLGDWISWYLSQLRGMDAIEVDVINFLKKELANVQN